MSISHVSAVISTPAPGPVGCWEPWMFAPAGEGTHPAVSPLPVPASARELQAALWVRQPAGGSQLWPQHGDLCRPEEQLGRPLLLWLCHILHFWTESVGVAKYLKGNFTIEEPLKFVQLWVKKMLWDAAVRVARVLELSHLYLMGVENPKHLELTYTWFRFFLGHSCVWPKGEFAEDARFWFLTMTSTYALVFFKWKTPMRLTFKWKLNQWLSKSGKSWNSEPFLVVSILKLKF